MKVKMKTYKILTAVLTGAILSLLYHTPLIARQTTFSVRQDGKGDFTSISEAVAAVPSGSTLSIHEGIYNEMVYIGDKTLYLTGTDRDKCILQYDGCNYFEPPLSIAAGTVSNLTIYSCAEKSEGWVDRPPAVVDPSIPVTAYKEYAIHIEQDYLAGRELTFDNCLILSDKSQCVGLGLRGNGSVSFLNCEFRSYGQGGILFAHDAASPDYVGECALRLINCELYNYRGVHFFSVQALHMESRVNLTFQNTLVHTVGYGYYDSARRDANRYTGKTIDELIALDTSDLLIENGHRINDMVYCLNEQQANQYFAYEITDIPSYNHKIPLPEGITRILAGQPAPIPQVDFPIYIDNTTLESSDGWCGCANFYLTPDSSGNTFADMNYQETVQATPDSSEGISDDMINQELETIQDTPDSSENISIDMNDQEQGTIQAAP